MSGWHTRFWRRVRVAPGVTINLSKSGPSLSVGPRGSKVTFGQRGVRQTMGIPGTGLFATRQLSSTPDAQPAAPSTVAAPVAFQAAPPAADATARYELHFGWPIIVAAVCGLAIAGAGYDAARAWAAAFIGFVAGLLYEVFAAHHPLAAKAIAQVAVAVIAVIAVIAGIAVVIFAAVLGTSSRSRRH